MKIPHKHSVLTWIIEYSAFLVNRFEVCHDGKNGMRTFEGKEGQGAWYCVWRDGELEDRTRNWTAWKARFHVGRRRVYPLECRESSAGSRGRQSQWGRSREWSRSDRQGTTRKTGARTGETWDRRRWDNRDDMRTADTLEPWMCVTRTHKNVRSTSAVSVLQKNVRATGECVYTFFFPTGRATSYRPYCGV